MSTERKFDRSLSTGCLQLMINRQERVEAYSRNSKFPAGKQNRYETRTHVHKRQEKSESKVWIHRGIVSPITIHIPLPPSFVINKVIPQYLGNLNLPVYILHYNYLTVSSVSLILICTLFSNIVSGLQTLVTNSQIYLCLVESIELYSFVCR